MLTKFKPAKAFTLAEVLITLGIIGIVAAITVPVLMHNIQDRQLKEAAKAAYSKASQAVQQLKSDQGGDLSSFTGNAYGLKTALMNYFKVIKDCNYYSCVTPANPSSAYNSLSHNQSDTNRTMSAGQFITTDGMFWGMSYDLVTGYITILVDVNGYQNKPNTFGRDTFMFELINDNLVPMGGANTEYPAPQYCKRALNSDWPYQGLGCMINIVQGIDY